MKRTRPILRSLSVGLVGVYALTGLGCSKAEAPSPGVEEPPPAEQILPAGIETGPEGPYAVFLARILAEAEIPSDLARYIQEVAAQGPAFLLDLLAVLEGDPYLRVLVDKEHALSAAYEPEDLVSLTGGSYQVSRSGLTLRKAAEMALEEMAAAARDAGVTLTASSAYRSYAYQERVYARNVQESGQEIADKESARPGHSQHQLGLVVDFGSIDDTFASTPAGRWIAAEAARFGWSLSYPQGYEALTGYRWECWHYRYVGKELAYFMDTYFQGIQQYALRFIYQWEKAGGL
jgi:D-alanyl-D-alanine carboxypeptidase